MRSRALRVLGVTILAVSVIASASSSAQAGRHRRPRRTPTPAAGSQLFADSFEGFRAGETWADGTIHGNWRSIYNGYGRTGTGSDGTVVHSQVPKASRSAGETHANLIATTQSFGDMDLAVRTRTAKQLRTGSAPNPWEVAWVLWHYTDDTHFYYVVLKPNGWELGKEDPAYPGAQRFLATGSSPSFPVGGWYTVRVVQAGATITVYANGTKLTQFTDTQRPYLSGGIALYNEDADVRFDDVRVVRP